MLVSMLFAYITTSATAKTSQYGEMYTGMPNGLQRTRPSLASRLGGRSASRCPESGFPPGVLAVTTRYYVLGGGSPGRAGQAGPIPRTGPDAGPASAGQRRADCRHRPLTCQGWNRCA